MYNELMKKFNKSASKNTKFLFFIPVVIMLIYGIMFFFIIDTPFNVNSNNWVEVEGTITKIRKESQRGYKDEDYHIMFPWLYPTIQYTTLEGDTLSQELLEGLDRHVGWFLHPVGSKINILYDKNEPYYIVRASTTMIFKIIIIIVGLLLVLFFIFRKRIKVNGIIDKIAAKLKT